MLGQMMNKPLVIGSLIDHAQQYHGQTEIVSVETSGGTVTTTWNDIAIGARKLASALEKFGIKQGDCCATLAWNNYRHLEIYFGVSSGGMVCHTLNPRLFADQMVYIINHAQDQILFVDKTFLPIVVALKDQLPTLKAVVLLSGHDEEAAATFPGLLFYDEFVSRGEDVPWPVFDENTASSLCFTSGTTGNPKGVLYSHRSTLLHTFAASLPDCLNISSRETLLPVVPMFHVNAWGTPYAAAMVGSRMVLPGPGLDGASLVKLIDQENVTLALGVPTIWQGLLQAAAQSGTKLKSLTRTVIGGSACPPSMMAEFREKYSVETIHAWGMTELSPIGTANQLLGKHKSLPNEEKQKLRVNQGRPPFGIELKITDDDGAELPRDGEAQGDLLVRGFWVLEDYFKGEGGAPLIDGWYPTGDVASLDEDGFMTIRDRSKDIIKSGGEWISSVELENIAIAHPDLADAAVIGATHEKWDERPILVAVNGEGKNPTADELLTWFDGKIAKWQIPDAVVFTKELPRNATGKVRKNLLREEFGKVLLS